MKKTIFIVMLVGLFVAASVLSFAQESKEMKGSMMEGKMMMGKEMKGSEVGEQGMMMGKGMMGKGMMKECMMHGMMMKMMMGKSIVATQDGGVVVMAGNKLLKYDRNLKLVKEAEIKMDMKDMHKKMQKMMKECGMMGKTMKESEEAGKLEERSEHEAHH